jgi:Ca2+-binding RTX toxin-like protein
VATYNFGTITTAESAAYRSATDDLLFTGVRDATATNITVTGAYMLRINTTGASVNLGPGAAGEVFTFADGSILSLGGGNGGSGNDQILGGVGNDELRGFAGDDILEGRGGQDTLTGGIGADTLTGGALGDRFDFGRGESGVAEGRIDVITDWDSLDRISFNSVFTSAYSTAHAGSYAEALDIANVRIANGSADIVVVQVASDTFLFFDSFADNGGADDAIKLAGRGLSQFSPAAVLASGQPLPPGSGTPGPVPGDPRGGSDTFASPVTGGDLFGGAGDDSLVGSSRGDRLDGGDGADTIYARGSDDTILGGAGNDVIRYAGFGGEVTLGAGADLIWMLEGQYFEEDALRILDWTWYEDAIRFVYMGPTNYGEGTASDYASALALAKRLVLDGFQVSAIQVGRDVFIFGNYDGLRFDSLVRLVDRTLADVSEINLGILPRAPITTPTEGPPAPARSTTGQVIVAGSMDAVDVSVLDASAVADVTLTRIVLDGPGLDIILTGSGFSTDAAREQLFGNVTGFQLGSRQNGSLEINATVAPRDLAALIATLDAGDTNALLSFVFGGADRMLGSAGGDLIRGYFGNDVILGNGGADSLFGGLGDDVIYAVGPDARGASQTYLRGDEGNDWIAGSDGFDDINGNAGSDTASGGAGDDWVVGGKDGDRLFGDAGDDLVYGNIGNDVCVGGEGDDTLRGGQDNDQLFGGPGADFLSGDRGSDTLVGGAGADLFHSFVGADLDRIEDFNAAEGDRLLLAAGTQYTLEQIGPDLNVHLTGGGRVLLVGVTLSSLPDGWII